MSDAFGTRGPAFALGLAAFKLLLVAAYLRERRWRGAQGLIRAYAGLYLLQATLWAASAMLPPTPRVALWGLALALDLASPWWVARYTTTVRPHPEHLPERFGLFTIILLGEGVASGVHALDHGSELHGQAVAAALVGVALTFGTWLGYFEVTRAHDEREVGGLGGWPKPAAVGLRPRSDLRRRVQPGSRHCGAGRRSDLDRAHNCCCCTSPASP